MTAQEAQTILELQSPFTGVELKSAHKNALVKWLPAQFMSDRVQLSKALEQTARIHEAYDLLLPRCEAEEEKRVNPWLEEAMRHAYGQAPSSSSTSVATSAEEKPSLPTASTAQVSPAPESAPRRQPILGPMGASPKVQTVALQNAEVDAPPATRHASPAPAPPVANPFLHDLSPLKTPEKIAAEGPKVELRGKSHSSAEQTSAASPVSSSQSGVHPSSEGTTPSRMDPAIRLRPPKVIIAPRLRGATVEPSMPVATVPVPLPLPPAAKYDQAAAPPPVAAPIAAPAPVETPAPLSAPVVSSTQAPAPVVAEAVVHPKSEPATVRAPVEESSSIQASPVIEKAEADVVSPVVPEELKAPSPPATEVAPVAEPLSESAAVPAPAPVSAPDATPAPHVSAAHAEEASAAEQAAHHVHLPAPASATAGSALVAHVAAPAPVPIAKPARAIVAQTKAKPETSAETDADDAQLAGDHALVPALGDRYHPAEREGSPNTDTSRHFPTRPVAPSGAIGVRARHAEDADAAAANRSAASTETSGTPKRTLSAWQKILRFFLGMLCVAGFGYGIYWVGQSNLGRDPWGMEPGSGGPGERIRKQGFESFKGAAENGNADAQMKVARAYQQGDGVAQNSEEAVKWFRKAAEQGHVDAQYALGDAYKSGSGVPQDNAEALKWYRTAEATRDEQREKKERKGKEKEKDLRLQ